MVVDDWLDSARSKGGGRRPRFTNARERTLLLIAFGFIHVLQLPPKGRMNKNMHIYTYTYSVP